MNNINYQTTVTGNLTTCLYQHGHSLIRSVINKIISIRAGPCKLLCIYVTSTVHVNITLSARAKGTSE